MHLPRIRLGLLALGVLLGGAIGAVVGGSLHHQRTVQASSASPTVTPSPSPLPVVTVTSSAASPNPSPRRAFAADRPGRRPRDRDHAGATPPVPEIGERVVVFGTWVLDTEHGWN